MARRLLDGPSERELWEKESGMGRFLRWTTTVGARIDAMVSRIENHDALVHAAIRDAREARARARVQLRRVRQDGERMQRRCAELAEAERRWRERAVRTAAESEERALECVRRSRSAGRERAELLATRSEHSRVETQLHHDLRRIDARIETLVQQRNVLRTRQSRAEALAAAQSEEYGGLADVDEILDRWEIKVSRVETDFACELDQDDDLDRSLGAEEDRAELRAELEDLLRSREAGADDAGAPGARS